MGLESGLNKLEGKPNSDEIDEPNDSDHNCGAHGKRFELLVLSEVNHCEWGKYTRATDHTAVFLSDNTCRFLASVY